ncbi:MAG: threonylcarbamoyl-AMP synthase [Gammaproteobacteria bacterium]|nr:threonylcarbamoyl-AMP synthase [Gammaproteobacteria bacterium]
MCALRVDLDEAVTRLRAGEAVAVPTETVYGLAADARNESALRRIFATKGRPLTNPLIVHIRGREQLTDWAASVPAAATALLDACWPGPLTLVLPARAEVSRLVTGGADSVALRCPSHPLFRELLARFGGALCAPSANRSGYVSPTTAEHVLADYSTEPLAVLDGGACALGIESTIVRPCGDMLDVLRPGAVPVERLRELWSGTVTVPASADVVVPGSAPRHYAPATRVQVVSRTALESAGHDDVVICRGTPPPTCARVECLPDEPIGYARGLYALLRRLDAGGYSRLLVEAVPEQERWQAVRDRLRRAALRR